MSTKALSRSASNIFHPNSASIERSPPHCPRMRVSCLGRSLDCPSSSKVASRVIGSTHTLPDEAPLNGKSKLSKLSLAESRFYLTRSDPSEYLSVQFKETEDEQETAPDSPPVRQASPSLSETSSSNSEEIVLTKSDLQKLEFHKLPSSPRKLDLFPDLFATALVNAERNRWPDILALEATRFCIAEEPLFYFNANWVLGRCGIAA